MNDAALAKKQRVARAALEYLRPGMILGVGTGSTVAALIEMLGTADPGLQGAVSSSERTSARLRALGLPLFDLNDVGALTLYIDGADEATRARQLIKGGGGALTREKILASAAERFICIVDDGKLVTRLGRFPLPVEVIPMARGFVAQRLARLGGSARWREGVLTDNGNHILDVHGLTIERPAELEAEINQIPGVVTVGLFAARPADLLLIGTGAGVEQL